ncbi:tetraketide alpha-pyrone reductase 1-like protein [Tanacetum coccineum]
MRKLPPVKLEQQPSDRLLFLHQLQQPLLQMSRQSLQAFAAQMEAHIQLMPSRRDRSHATKEHGALLLIVTFPERIASFVGDVDRPASALYDCSMTETNSINVSECSSRNTTSMDNVNVPIVSSPDRCMPQVDVPGVADSVPATDPVTCHVGSSGHPRGPPVGHVHLGACDQTCQHCGAHFDMSSESSDGKVFVLQEPFWVHSFHGLFSFCWLVVTLFMLLVRSLADPKKTEHLLALDGAKERLSLYEANLIEDGSFDSAVKGCVCVFHTASPVQLTVDDPQAQLIDPAVKGALNVLKSASKVSSLKRVVFTSSIFAVVCEAKVPVFGDMVDETWFSDPLLKGTTNAQRLAENAAVKFSQENGMDLVSINPGFVIGPILQPTLNLTSEGFMNLIECGKEVFPDGVYRLVDVRDVAIAHILLLKIRKLTVDTVWCKDGKSLEPLIYNVSRVKVESLGVEFTPVEGRFRVTCASELIASWLVKLLLVRGYTDHATV